MPLFSKCWNNCFNKITEKSFFRWRLERLWINRPSNSLFLRKHFFPIFLMSLRNFGDYLVQLLLFYFLNWFIWDRFIHVNSNLIVPKSYGWVDVSIAIVLAITSLTLTHVFLQRVVFCNIAYVFSAYGPRIENTKLSYPHHLELR